MPPNRPCPSRFITAVLAVVVREDQVLLVQSANPPNVGLWGFPGGKVEFGETLLAAAERELLGETGVRAAADRVFTAVDTYDLWEGHIRQHFVLIAVRCHWLGDEPSAADDALDARWFPTEHLERSVVLSRDVAAVARQAALIV